MKKNHTSQLQTILTVISVSCLLISNIVTSKQMLLPFGITMTCGIFVFPITYILSDVFSEIYGYKWSRLTCYLGFVMNLLMVGVFELSIKTPAPAYWQNQEAFATVLGNTPRVLIASLVSFLIGDYANDKVFSKMKSKHINSHEGFSTRAITSSFCGELIDSCIFVPLAFLGQMPIKTLLTMIMIQVSIKMIYEIIILPITNCFVRKVSEYEKRSEING